jgi:hypothetical protein
VAVNPGIYYQQFVYVRTRASAPTGLYDHSYIKDMVDLRGDATEEFGLYNGRYITRAEYDDGAAVIDGEPVDVRDNVELRVRYITPSNFVLAAQGSPINNTAFDRRRQELLNGILRGDNTVEDLAVPYTNCRNATRCATSEAERLCWPLTRWIWSDSIVRGPRCGPFNDGPGTETCGDERVCLPPYHRYTLRFRLRRLHGSSLGLARWAQPCGSCVRLQNKDGVVGVDVKKSSSRRWTKAPATIEAWRQGMRFDPTTPRTRQRRSSFAEYLAGNSSIHGYYRSCMFQADYSTDSSSAEREDAIPVRSSLTAGFQRFRIWKKRLDPRCAI